MIVPCPSRLPRGPVGDGAVDVGLPARRPAIVLAADAACRAARAAHRRARRAERPPACPQPADPAHRRPRDRRRDPHPGAASSSQLDGPYAGILLGTLCVAAIGLRRRHPRACSPARSSSGVAAIALIPVRRLRRDVRPHHAAGDRRPRLRRAAYPADGLVDHRARESRQPDRRHGRARRRASSRSPRGSFALLAASFGRIDAGRARRDRVRRDARASCATTTTRRGSSWATAARSRWAFCSPRSPSRACSRRRRRSRSLAPLLVVAVPILDTSFVVLKRLKYRRAPWGADHNHFYHRFMRIGFSQRRTAAYLHVWAALLAALRDPRQRFVPAAPGWRVGPRQHPDRRSRQACSWSARLGLDGLHARDPQGAPPAAVGPRTFVEARMGDEEEARDGGVRGGRAFARPRRGGGYARARPHSAGSRSGGSARRRSSAGSRRTRC